MVRSGSHLEMVLVVSFSAAALSFSPSPLGLQMSQRSDEAAHLSRRGFLAAASFALVSQAAYAQEELVPRIPVAERIKAPAGW